jgi:uncharacterized YigZ family protein
MPDETFDSYLTLEKPLRAPELKVKGSRFIADIVPVQTKADIEHSLAMIRKEFYDATHHCFAYRVGPRAEQVRAADDGEPSGTAGKPILLTLTSAALTDALLIVTRYFGGTKLGTGPLARAYAESAQAAVAAATIRTVYLTERIALAVPYDDAPHVERLIRQFGGAITSATYSESVTLEFEIRRSLIHQILDDLTNEFSGRIGIPER